MNFDEQSTTTEGYVIKDPAGNYLHISSQTTHTGHHVYVRGVRLSQATIFPRPFGDVDKLRGKEPEAIRQYQREIPDGTLESIHVVRTAHITVTEKPLAPGEKNPTR